VSGGAGDGPLTTRGLHLDDLPGIDIEGMLWHPLRRELGLTGFGAAVYSAPAADGELIEPHDELSTGAGGHEELYVVLRGRARFTLDGVEHDAPTGTCVAVPVGVRRSATAIEAGTQVLVVGGKPGAALPVSPFEHWYAALGPLHAGDPAGAAEVAAAGLADNPENGHLHYQLACFLSLAGQHQEALVHLRTAVANEPRAWGWLADDADLDPIRDLPGFPRPEERP
jgi:hypothetical protein